MEMDKSMRALLFTTGSPFARGVRVILDELDLAYEKREEITTPTVESRAAASPTLQVPTLWDNGNVLWESGLICEYLLSTYPEQRAAMPPLAKKPWRSPSEWQDRLIFATIQTLGSAATTISQLRWSGIAYKDNDYLTRCADRLPHLLPWLEEKLINQTEGFYTGEISIQDIFLICHLSFIANRPLSLDPGLSSFPKINALLARMEQRQSFQENPVLWWEPGVVGYGEDGKTPIYAS